MTPSALFLTKPPVTSEQRRRSPLPLLRNKRNRQLFTSGNNDNAQNSGLCRRVHLAVREAAAGSPRLEAPSFPRPAPPRPSLTGAARAAPRLRREPRSAARRGLATPHFTSEKGTSARKKQTYRQIDFGDSHRGARGWAVTPELSHHALDVLLLTELPLALNS